MIDNINYFFNTGVALIYYYQSNSTQQIQTFNTAALLRNFLLNFLIDNWKQIGTYNSATGEIYYLNFANVKSIDYVNGETSILIIFKDKTELIIDFIDSDQANDHYYNMLELHKSNNMVSYLLTKNKLYVHPDNVEDIPNGIFSDIQTAIDNKSSGDVIYLQTGDFILADPLLIEDSTEIYCESDVSISVASGYVLTVEAGSNTNVSVRIYGYPVIAGEISLHESTSGDEDTGLYTFLSYDTFTGTLSKNNNGRTIVKGFSQTTTAVSSAIDTDTLREVMDIDVLYITPKGSGYVLYPLTNSYTRFYFRNTVLKNRLYLQDASGVYTLTMVNCKLTGFVELGEGGSNAVNIWGCYFSTTNAEFVYSGDLEPFYLNIYNNNLSNKPYPSNVILGGSGNLTIY